MRSNSCCVCVRVCVFFNFSVIVVVSKYIIKWSMSCGWFSTKNKDRKKERTWISFFKKENKSRVYFNCTMYDTKWVKHINTVHTYDPPKEPRCLIIQFMLIELNWNWKENNIFFLHFTQQPWFLCVLCMLKLCLCDLTKENQTKLNNFKNPKCMLDFMECTYRHYWCHLVLQVKAAHI